MNGSRVVAISTITAEMNDPDVHVANSSDRQIVSGATKHL